MSNLSAPTLDVSIHAISDRPGEQCQPVACEKAKEVLDHRFRLKNETLAHLRFAHPEHPRLDQAGVWFSAVGGEPKPDAGVDEQRGHVEASLPP